MIWDPGIRETIGVSSIADDLILQMAEVCGSCSEISDEAYAEVAFAVEAAVADAEVAVASSQESLVLLAARAIHGLGYRKAASRLYVLGTEIVRPTEWASLGDMTVWVLDLVRLAQASDLSLEIGFRRTVLGVVDTIAYVWDDTDGVGALALEKFMMPAAAGGGNRLHKRSRRDELVEMVQLKLEKLASGRNWTAVPKVITAEL